MSDFLNPLGGRFIGPSGPVAPSAVAGTVPDPPRAFQQLDPGTIIKGVVLGRESDGLTAIATDKGTIRVASNALLPAGAQVTLEVRPAGDRLQVLILANDAVPRGAGHNTPASSSAAGAQAPQTASGQPAAAPTTTQPTQPPVLPATSALGPDARGPDPRAPDMRGPQGAPATTTPTRNDQPSIQFVGASLRAVVVQAPPPQPQTLPTPQTAPPPAQNQLPPAQPLPVQPQPLPTPQQPVQLQPLPPQPQPLPAPQQSVQSQPLPPQPQPLPTPQQPVQSQPLPPQPQPLPAPLQPVQLRPLPPQPLPTPQQPVQSQPLPPTPVVSAPIVTTGPVPAPPPPVPTNTTTPVTPPPLTTQPIPTGSIPVGTLPAPPVATTPGTTPPQTTAPAVTIPAPTAPAQPVPQGNPVPPAAAILSPAVTTNAATLQAALIAATTDKKGGRTPPPISSPNAAPQRPGMPVSPDVPAAPGRPADHVTPPAAAHPAGVMSQVPAGTTLTADARLRILALFASAAVMPEAGRLPPATVTESEAPFLGKTPAVPLPLGAELKLRVLAVQMQANQAIEIDPIDGDPDGRGHVIFGRVVAVTPAGHAVIHTPLGDIMLQNRSSLPVGARLALAIDTLEAAPPPAAIAVPVVQTPQQALLSLAQSWPTLADLIAIFQGASTSAAKPPTLDPDIARQALGVLPHAGNKLGAGMMNAMAALRSGDIGKLLGPLFAAKGAGTEREEMVRRLRSEFAQLSALAQDRPEIDWRALFLPVIDDQGRVGQINLFYRRPKKGDADGRAGDRTGTRFVVEADFSKLGPFQLDGLMRQQRFDLMIRSRTRLSDRMRLDIEAIYEEARGLTGFTGSIAFQTVDEFPVIPLDDLKRSTPTVTV